MAIDEAGLRATQNIAVSVTLFARTTLTRTLDENAPAAEPVGDPISVPDLHILAYSLSGADADSFDIDARTGQIRTRTGITYDYERDETFSLNVVATDGDNADSIAVTIAVKDVNEPPSLPPSNLSVQPGDQSLTAHFHAARDEPGKPPVQGVSRRDSHRRGGRLGQPQDHLRTHQQQRVLRGLGPSASVP